MSDLTQLRCIACRSDSPHVTNEEITELSAQVADWTLKMEDNIRKLERVFRFKNFKDALAFSNAVGDIAEEEGHHPRIVTEWGRVRITWWTHKIRDLHRNDFIMSAKTDALYPGLTESK